MKKPPKTVQDFLDHINSVLKDQGLSDFYKPDDLRLKEIAEKAAEYAKNHPDGPLGKPEDTADLCQLGLYDNICFLGTPQQSFLFISYMLTFQRRQWLHERR